MKKIYMAPVSQSIEVRCDGMLALSCTDDTTLGSGDVGESGDFEICSEGKEYWDTEW
ncbi:MAG: hypothetical protein ACI3YD_05845 [Alloprevotella sp.]